MSTLINGYEVVIGLETHAQLQTHSKIFSGASIAFGAEPNRQACAVDIAYAHESASARLSELAIGIGPFVVGPAVERKVGTGLFGLLSATPATRRSSAWCEQHGLYAEVFPTIEALDERINAHAKELVAYSPEAMADLKKVMWTGTEDWDTLLTERATVSGRLVLSDFTRSAIAAFKAATAKR